MPIAACASWSPGHGPVRQFESTCACTCACIVCASFIEPAGTMRNCHPIACPTDSDGPTSDPMVDHFGVFFLVSHEPPAAAEKQKKDKCLLIRVQRKWSNHRQVNIGCVESECDGVSTRCKSDRAIWSANLNTLIHKWLVTCHGRSLANFQGEWSLESRSFQTSTCCKIRPLRILKVWRI